VDLVWVGLGGAAGAVLRYVVDSAITLAGAGPGWGTLVVNLSGSFVLGVLFGVVTEHGALSDPWRLAVAVGFLGAYTTFSTLMLEVFRTAEAGDVPWAVANVIGSIVLGLVAVAGGVAIGRALA
jgi:CrcB protein